MEIWPAVDWFDMHMVRLEKGRYDAVTQYGTDPLGVFNARYRRMPKRIHLIDLQGARSGQFGAWSLLSRLHGEGIEIEAGGGIRDEVTIERALNQGARRVILGTRLLTDPKWAQELLTHFRAEQLVAGIDIAKGRARLHGWIQEGEDGQRLWHDLYQQGFRLCNVTDISRDGTLSGIHEPFWQNVASGYSGDIGAGGGIRSADDIKTLEQLGIHRCVIGKAWVNGEIDLSEWEGVF